VKKKRGSLHDEYDGKRIGEKKDTTSKTRVHQERTEQEGGGRTGDGLGREGEKPKEEIRSMNSKQVRNIKR